MKEEKQHKSTKPTIQPDVDTIESMFVNFIQKQMTITFLKMSSLIAVFQIRALIIQLRVVVFMREMRNERRSKNNNNCVSTDIEWLISLQPSRCCDQTTTNIDSSLTGRDSEMKCGDRTDSLMITTHCRRGGCRECRWRPYELRTLNGVFEYIGT